MSAHVTPEHIMHIGLGFMSSKVLLFGSRARALHRLIETRGGFDYTAAQFAGWCKEAGFSRTEVMPLTGPTSAAIAYK